MNLKTTLTSAAITVAIAFSPINYAKEEVEEKKEQASSWLSLSEQELNAVEVYAEDYKDYIYKTPTELTFVSETITRAENQGFKRLTEQR